MSDERQNNQSVKDILEDIKKAISDTGNGDKVDMEDENNDVLYLDEEYEEDIEEKGDSEDNIENENHDLQSGEAIYGQSYNSSEEEESIADSLYETDGQSYKVESQNDESRSNVPQNNYNKLYSMEPQSDDHLVLKENMEEIKMLLGKMQSELQQQQKSPSDYNLTVEELVMSLLKPELSEWLNKHLYKLVKEVVEKEIRDIINNSK